MYALVIYSRAAAERQGIAVDDIAREIATRHELLDLLDDLVQR